MISKSTRSKRRYTLMRQEIIQAARQIILDQGIDALSMRTIARLVQTSPANLYEYFLNKEEIVFSVYSDTLSNLLTSLQLVCPDDTGQAQLVLLCTRYINFVDQDPTQRQIARHLLQIEPLMQPSRMTKPTIPPRNASTTTDPSVQSSKTDRAEQLGDAYYGNPTTNVYITQLEEIFALFLKAVKQCREEGTISSAALTDQEITHIVWAFIHGLVTLRIQEISTIDREIMCTAIVNFIDSLTTI